MAVSIKISPKSLAAAAAKLRREARRSLKSSIRRGCRIGLEAHRLDLIGLGDSPSSRLRLARGLLDAEAEVVCRIRSIAERWNNG